MRFRLADTGQELAIAISWATLCLHRKMHSGQAARPISTGQLHAFQRFHLRPINLLV